MFRKAFFWLLLAAAAGVSRAEDDRAERFRRRWNDGVGYYHAGDVTNALRVMESVMRDPDRLNQRYRTHAAEIVAKLAYESAHAEDSANPAESLEKAAQAAQRALQANPDDARANRNFTRAIDGLPALREARHVNEVQARDGQKDPADLLQRATETVRRLMTDSGACLQLPAAQAVEKSAALSAEAERLADVWISVGQLVQQSVTNEAQAATIVAQTDQVRKRTRDAARQLEDMEAEAYTTLSDVEADYTRFLKSVIPPPAAIRADLVAQSNAWQDVEMFNNRPWQPDAHDYTQAFRQRFPAWAQNYQMQAQADTNKPPFTAEAQAQVVKLSDELEKIQSECCQAPNPTLQEKAIDLIRQIIELLPNDPGGGSQQPQQNQQPEDQDQNSPNNAPQNAGNQDDQGQQPEPQEDSADGGEQEDASGEGAEEDSPEAREIEAVLKKAQERNDEHEAEKKARVRRAKLPPNERDW